MNLNYYNGKYDGYLSHSKYSEDEERISRSDSWNKTLEEFETELEVNKLKASTNLVFKLYKQLCLIKKQYGIEITLDYIMGSIVMKSKFLNKKEEFAYYEDDFPEAKEMITIEKLCSGFNDEFNFGDLPNFEFITNTSEYFAQTIINNLQYFYEIAKELLQNQSLTYWSDISSSNQYIKDLFNCQIPELISTEEWKRFVQSKEFKSIRKKMLAVYKKNFKDDKVF